MYEKQGILKMDMQKKYEECFSAYRKAAEKGEGKNPGIVMGYTSDLDAVADWEAGRLNRLIEQCGLKEISFQEGETIDSMEDFCRILCYFAIHGLGGEIALTSQEVVEEMKKHFQLHYSPGGTCAQGAAAMGELGISVLAHFTDRSREVMLFPHYRNILSVKEKQAVPIRECATEEKPLLHLILQYSRGDVIRVNGEEYTVPVSNRLILVFDEVHKYVPIEADFRNYVEEHAKDYRLYNISGFNAIRDAGVMEEKIRELKEHFRKVKEKNPDMIIYYESAHFHNYKVRNQLYRAVPDFADIMGMNEEELEDMARKCGIIVDREDIASVILTLEEILHIYPVKGIVMHSKDYAMYYGEDLKGIDIEKGLIFGQLLAGSRARIGHFAGWEDCRESLSVPLSKQGIAFGEKLKEMQTRHKVVFVPSRYISRPLGTIGLGDTFLAGLQLCFVYQVGDNSRARTRLRVLNEN